MTTPMTIEDLAKLINPPSVKKPRKKAERTQEQEDAMMSRMAVMREKSLEARKKKKEAKNTLPPVENIIVTPLEKQQPKVVAPTRPEGELFEKHYANKLDKLDENMSNIKESLSEMKEMKRQKAEERKREKEQTIKAKEEEKEKKDSEIQKQPAPVANVVTPTPVAINPNKIPKNTNYKSFFKR